MVEESQPLYKYDPTDSETIGRFGRPISFIQHLTSSHRSPQSNHNGGRTIS